ncbi:MAG: hypothetical protein O9284_04500 [Steroidobacteraceae bacterium]|jgi:hypothetical protein|nr:hypothetical protein [Steroidobacteraceae bacterium]
MKAAEAIVTLASLTRGPRPFSFENREAEEVLNVALALLVELGVAFDRIDRLERLLAERTGISLDDLRATDYDGAAGAERQAARDALMARVLRIALDARVPSDGRG